MSHVLPIDHQASQVARALGSLAGLVVLVAVRVGLNGTSVPTAFVAGTVFGVGLIGLAALAGTPVRRPSLHAVTVGIAGGVALVAIPMLARAGPAISIGIHPEPFVAWLAITSLVATGEELVLRGILFEELRIVTGLSGAIAITTVCFALIHVPLYGWHVVPLDLAVGVFLSGLRVWSGGVAAPSIAHTLADLATWWR